MQIKSILAAAATFVSVFAFAHSSLAAPVTYTITGVVNSNQSGTGLLANAFVQGDTWTLVSQFDDAATPDDSPSGSGYARNEWYLGGGSMSLTINGFTYSISGGGYNAAEFAQFNFSSVGVSRVAGSFDNGNGTTQYMAQSNGDNVSVNSTNPAVNWAYISWNLFSSNGSNPLGSNLYFPQTVNLADWNTRNLSLQVYGPNGAAAFDSQQFTSFTVSSSGGGTGVPAPGALALLGLGLLGIAGLRRRKAA
jgi:hypothetical protein